jgi:hypothetical protein
MIGRLLTSVASTTVLVLLPVVARAVVDVSANMLRIVGQSASSESEAAKEVLALEDQMDALLRSNSAERTALWAEETTSTTTVLCLTRPGSPHVPPAQSSAAYAADNPFVGTWKLNLSKSRITSPDGIQPVPLVKSIVTYVLDENQVKVTDDDTFTDGHSIHMEWLGNFDGKDYPVTGDPTADTWSYKKLNDHTLILTTKRDGTILATRRVTVSADGKTRTLTGTRAEANGKKATVVAVYDKE